MSYSPAILNSTTSHLQKVFEVENLPASDLEALCFKLSRVVLHLLHTDLNRLLHLLYRIDVEEQQVKQAMVADDAEIIAERLARLIVKRELQKAQLRLRYS
ncbi:hypothetical protein I2I11_03540 [Pontibacter sp. 172403-2]|uniref:hypothetical protein n=1 Tax=Pontibacter rufus TaxID=2791028 RepID=UPI0018AF6E60|nr:hypothetical protein [Pontibacter sp. 172403-2]MBF9252357.1 hypothetical protein [Pontibacter sp. 172403-2]